MSRKNQRKVTEMQLETIEEIAKLNRQRILIKKKVCSIKTSLKNVANISNNELKVLQPVLQKCADNHERISEKLLGLVDSGQVDSVSTEITELDNLIREVQAKLLDFLDQIEDNTSDVSSQHSSEEQNVTMIPGQAGLTSSTMIEPTDKGTERSTSDMTHVNAQFNMPYSVAQNANQQIQSNVVPNLMGHTQISFHPDLHSNQQLPKIGIPNFPQTSHMPLSSGAFPNQPVNNNIVTNSKYPNNFNEPFQFNPVPIKPPSIEIPTFDGNPLNWLTFKQLFLSIIHNRNDIDDIVKYSYLIKHLTGKAKVGLGHITLTSAGYQTAWQQLLIEYDNNCILVDTHIDHLLTLPYCNKEGSSELRNLLNTCQLHINTLEALNYKMDQLSERILVNIVKKRFDNFTRKLWEEQQNIKCFPSYNSLITFIQRRCQILESLESFKKPYIPNKIDQIKPSSNKFSHNKSFSATISHTSSKIKNTPTNSRPNNKSLSKSCLVCNKNNHSVYNCLKFLKLSINDRINKIKEIHACLNCLQNNHTVDDCPSSNTCKLCQHKHNSLLHIGTSNSSIVKVQTNTLSVSQNTDLNSGQIVEQNQNSVTKSHSHCTIKSEKSKSVLLSTAIILISNKNGSYSQCRVLLDSGSQSNFISKHLAEKLKLDKIPVNSSISLLNDHKTSITHKLKTKIKSRISNFTKCIEFHIVPTVVESFPNSNINISRWSIPNNIELADTSFNIAGPIDALLGADIYYQTLNLNRILNHHNQPSLIETKFGWILGGSYTEDSCSFSLINQQMLNVDEIIEENNDNDLDILLPRFWDVKEYPIKKHLSHEENDCETHFLNTFKRNDTGRFIVRLPFKSNVDDLGESRPLAMKRFLYLERKLEGNDSLRKEYTHFIEEYLNLGHMRLVDETHDNQDQKSFYLPHHCVVKSTSSSTKLRVVFDASMKSTSGFSLNDVLMVGPVVQDDLFSIVLRLRKHSIVLLADVKKMYRQVKVDDNDTPYQRILWRDDSSKPIMTYELTTVTYGTSAAPYLATRVLTQLAHEEKVNYPQSSKSIAEDFYVDDMLTGASSVEEALSIYKEVSSLLHSGGLELHKWSSNSEELLKHIPENIREILQHDEISGNDTIRTLGLLWQPKRDVFNFNIESMNQTKFTKRSLLSEIARMYDPLGLLSPTIILARIIMQNLWKSHINWDDSISEEIQSSWLTLRDNLRSLREIDLDRYILLDEYDRVELHGFSDASQVAYGACLYVKCIKDNQVTTKLLCSKSRVAPLKTLSIAKLELCAALLLAQLASKAIEALKIDFNHIQFWTDSEIVIAWIKTPPFKLKVFTANRVAEIQSLSQNIKWLHVPSADNPADLISRGVMPQYLPKNHQWWNGPHFLQTLTCNYTDKVDCISIILQIPELKKEYEASNNFASIEQNIVPENFDLFTRFGCMDKLIRVTAYIFRFYNFIKTKADKIKGSLTCDEISNASMRLIRVIQNGSFKKEIETLSKNHLLPNSSNIKNLNPFLDQDGVLRVGGRLRNSDYDFNQKHQILLPHSHYFTDLLFRKYHLKNFHAGPSLLVSLIRQHFWPINAKQKAKKIVNSCVACFRMKPVVVNQIMGDLPKDRLQPCIPFSVSGVDFCGPFVIKNKYQRNSPDFKIYVSIFVCFSTKAIHLEPVSDLTAESFISCLKRFISRRGKPSKLWSDNGTNFCGSNNILNKLFQQFMSTESFEKINRFLTNDSIEWKFIPPRSPNFGGLWESSVKSFKNHFKKSVTSVNLNYEEFNTIIIQIEGILNSRPLYPCSNCPSDPQVLTPGHFLIGAPLVALPEPSLCDISSNRLTRWQRVTQVVQLFWKKFSVEYLHNLQVRQKWKTTKNNVKIGDICLIKDENLSPFNWLLGRVTDVTLGNDSNVRVVQLKTQKGIISRAISNICPLPIEDNVK